MNSKILWAWILSFIFNSLFAQEPFSIVIIGGGPTGLCTAIEARLAGAQVTMVECKENYTRSQYVLLLEPSLNQLNEWGVNPPELVLGQNEENKIGMIQIKNLEIALAKKAKELGILKVRGKFEELIDRHVLICTREGVKIIYYDLLVGADGTHSCTRKYLNIDTRLYSYGLASISFIFKNNSEIGVIYPQKCDSLFVNKLVAPTALVLCAQGHSLSKKKLVDSILLLEWKEEAKAILANESTYFDKIEVWLQQANTFSSRDRAAIILGDAAASGSFLQGMGVNHAIETACIAGQFFRSNLYDFDYDAFNAVMQVTTDKLIQDSEYLFE